MFDGLPTSRYNTLVIDPPWPISMAGKRTRRRDKRPQELPYKTLSLEEIATFPVPSLVNPGGHVYLWVTNKYLPDAFPILAGWGLRYHVCIQLIKRSGIAPCNGYVFACEYCLLGINGRPMQAFQRIGRLNWLSVNPIPGKHSVKPDAFYKLVEEMSPGPRLDAFARVRRENWDTWGDELPSP